MHARIYIWKEDGDSTKKNENPMRKRKSDSTIIGFDCLYIRLPLFLCEWNEIDLGAYEHFH